MNLPPLRRLQTLNKLFSYFLKTDWLGYIALKPKNPRKKTPDCQKSAKICLFFVFFYKQISNFQQNLVYHILRDISLLEMCNFYLWRELQDYDYTKNTILCLANSLINPQIKLPFYFFSCQKLFFYKTSFKSSK